MVYIGKRALESNIAELVLLDFVLPIERPNMIVVVVVPLEKQLKVEMRNMIIISSKELCHGCACIAVQIPQSSIEIKKKMLVIFQNVSPIFFIPKASDERTTLQRKKAMIILGRALGLCL